MEIMAPLVRLNEVEWASLEHAYGDAGDVPEMLRALRSSDPQTREQARGQLSASLDHQGVQRFESTLRAVPFLIGLVADPTTPERDGIARLLADFAVGDSCWFLHNGVHPEQQVECDGTTRPQAWAEVGGGDFTVRSFPRLPDGALDLSPECGLRFIYDSVAAGMPAYLEALPKGDEHLRAAIPFLLAFLTVDPGPAVPALTALLADPSERVRASAALGLSHATKFVPELWEAAFGKLSARWGRELGELERRCLALALVRYETPERTGAVREYLRHALEEGVPPVLPDARFPWIRIDCAPFLFCTTWLGTAEEDHADLRQPALSALGRLTDTHDAADLAVWCASFWVPTSDVPLEPARLDDELRGTLASLVANPHAWHFTDLGDALRGRGVPTSREELAAWLGVDVD